MKRTFLNGDKDFAIKAKNHLESRALDFKRFMEMDDYENEDNAYYLGSFYDYGLSFSYTAPGTFADQHEGYFCFQLSWGGPSDEVRFYYDMGAKYPYRIEYVFMDWGTGAGYDVTDEDWAIWLFGWFDGCDSFRHEYEKAMEESY